MTGVGSSLSDSFSSISILYWKGPIGDIGARTRAGAAGPPAAGPPGAGPPGAAPPGAGPPGAGPPGAAAAGAAGPPPGTAARLLPSCSFSTFIHLANLHFVVSSSVLRVTLILIVVARLKLL